MGGGSTRPMVDGLLGLDQMHLHATTGTSDSSNGADRPRANNGDSVIQCHG
jgi:hypothetical protein